MQYLIFGANGYIGSYLYRRFTEENFDVLGTSRREQEKGEYIFFDIRKDTFPQIPNQGKDSTAIICLAETNIDRCYEDYETAYNINVTRTIDLIEELRKQKFHIICFSTDNVFDGSCGNYTETNQTHPINCYGRTKADMEFRIKENFPEVCVFRISKTIGITTHEKNVFTEWARCFKSKEIPCIRGNRISFVFNEDIYQACKVASESKMSGLYNIVGDRGYSRAELARQFVRIANRQDVLVKEYDMNYFPFKDKRPLDVTMKNDKFRADTGYCFTDMEYVVKKFFDM